MGKLRDFMFNIGCIEYADSKKESRRKDKGDSGNSDARDDFREESTASRAAQSQSSTRGADRTYSRTDYDQQDRRPTPDNMVEFKSLYNQQKPAADSQQHTVIHTVCTLDDCENVINDLLEDRQILLNLENAEPALRRRIIDMVYGAAYALESDMRLVSRDTYIIARRGVLLRDVDGASQGRNSGNVTDFRY